jgi:hypothetical protein
MDVAGESINKWTPVIEGKVPNAWRKYPELNQNRSSK